MHRYEISCFKAVTVVLKQALEDLNATASYMKSIREFFHPPHARVEGIVYFDVDESDLAVLDDFEGEYYFRTSVSLESPDQGALQAEVYVIRSEYSNLLSGESWSETKFETVGLPRFMKQYLG